MSDRVPLTLIGADPWAREWWQPNWIDYRSSVANVERRKDHGEDVAICDKCGCETDLDPVPHSPKCTAIATVKTTVSESSRSQTAGLGSQTSNGSVDHGRDLLDRMDAGDPLGESDDLTRENDVEDEPPDDAASVEERRDRRYVSPVSDRWTSDAIIEVIQAIASETGFVPAQRDFNGPSTERRPNLAIIKRVFGSFGAAVEAAGYPRPRRGMAPLAIAAAAEIEGSGREPQAVSEGPGDDTSLATVSPEADDTTRLEPASRPDNEHGRRRAWDKADVIAAIRRWNAEYGQPPTSTEWARRVDGYPTTTTVATRFGAWANAIEAAGFPRPTRGGVPLKPAAAPAKRVRVRGTGLTYATAEAAYLAADEIEADGSRVAEQARFDGNEAKAEMAIDQSRELAEKIRDAAHAFEARTNGGTHNGQSETSGSSTSDEVAKPEVVPFRAVARALIAGMRAAADALEHELGEDPGA